ncbi:MAG: hypothetical protein V7L21_20195 [Nostoc sp.]
MWGKFAFLDEKGKRSLPLLLKQLDKYAFQVLTMVGEGYSSRQIAQQFI